MCFLNLSYVVRSLKKAEVSNQPTIKGTFKHTENLHVKLKKRCSELTLPFRLKLLTTCWLYRLRVSSLAWVMIVMGKLSWCFFDLSDSRTDDDDDDDVWAVDYTVG